jgi:hypothetical protein
MLSQTDQALMVRWIAAERELAARIAAVPSGRLGL